VIITYEQLHRLRYELQYINYRHQSVQNTADNSIVRSYRCIVFVVDFCTAHGRFVQRRLRNLTLYCTDVCAFTCWNTTYCLLSTSAIKYI